MIRLLCWMHDVCWIPWLIFFWTTSPPRTPVDQLIGFLNSWRLLWWHGQEMTEWWVRWAGCFFCGGKTPSSTKNGGGTDPASRRHSGLCHPWLTHFTGANWRGVDCVEWMVPSWHVPICEFSWIQDCKLWRWHWGPHDIHPKPSWAKHIVAFIDQQEPMISAHLAAAVETTFDVVFFVEFCCRITKPGRKDLQIAALDRLDDSECV